MTDDTWANVANLFVDEAYSTVKGTVRTRVMHRQLLEHLPPVPASVLDVGGGAGNQSFPLAALGYDVTLLDSSPAMLDKARQSLERLPREARERITLVEGTGEDAAKALGRRFDAVLCHGVLGYLDDPQTMLTQLSECAAPGGIVSIMTANAETMAIRAAMEQRWSDALRSFDATHEIGVLGISSRADTVDDLSERLRGLGVEKLAWYGVWLFADLLGFAGIELDPTDEAKLDETIAVEFEASRRDPYRSFSRVFHLVGRKAS